MPDSDEFWSLVDKSGECWNWLGGKTRGYGLFGRSRAFAHRLSYEATHGPIPTGLLIDHKCHNRSCVNPDHLQLATYSENGQNRAGAQANSQSGVRGVYPAYGKWRVQIRAGGRNHSGGVFTDLAEATAAASRLRASLMPNSLRDLEVVR
jgi:hypothetical protein